MLTGRRPAKNAKEVEAIGRGQISDAVAAIIEKAMKPNPDERYQTASDMLSDFEHLYEHDRRTIKRRKRARIAAAVWACLVAVGGMTVYTGLRQMERRQNMYALAGDSQEALQKVMCNQQSILHCWHFRKVTVFLRHQLLQKRKSAYGCVRCI